MAVFQKWSGQRKARPGAVRRTPRWRAERRPCSREGARQQRTMVAPLGAPSPSFVEGCEERGRRRAYPGPRPTIRVMALGLMIGCLKSESEKMRNGRATHTASCPALCRASTSFYVKSKADVDGRDEPGHDTSWRGADTCFAAVARMSEANAGMTPPDFAALIRATR